MTQCRDVRDAAGAGRRHHVRGRGHRRRRGRPPARSCSTPCCRATRRSSPIRPTPGRSSPSPTRTSATTGSPWTTTRPPAVLPRRHRARPGPPAVELAQRGRPRRLAPATACPASPASTPAGSPATSATSAPCPARSGPRRHRRGRAARRAARPSRAPTASTSSRTVTTPSRTGWPTAAAARGRLRLRHQATILRHLARGSTSRWCPRRPRPPTCSPGSPTACSSPTGRAIPPRCPYAIDAIAACSAGCRCSASASATSCSPRARRRHLQASVRPSRRQPSRPQTGHRQRRDHQPEPQLRRRRRGLGRLGRRHPRQPQRRRHRGDPLPRHPPRSACSTTRRPAPAPTTARVSVRGLRRHARRPWAPSARRRPATRSPSTGWPDASE